MASASTPGSAPLCLVDYDGRSALTIEMTVDSLGRSLKIIKREWVDDRTLDAGTVNLWPEEG